MKAFFSIPGSQVNYVAKCFQTVPYTHPDSAKLQLLSRILSSCYLHREIREKGGAYGAGLTSYGQTLGFYSYRDPNVVNTLNVFDNSLQWLHSEDFKDKDIEEGLLSVFSDIDHPLSPSEKGVLEFDTEITYDMRQKRSEQLFAITKKDLLDAAEKYILCKNQLEGSVAVFGSEQSCDLFKGDSSWKIEELSLG